MSRFNKSTVGKDITTNLAGGKAYRISPELDLYTRVCCSVLSDSYYQSASTELQQIRELVHLVSPEFVARLAVYARTKMNLRTIPLVLITELARIHNGDDLVSRAIAGSVKRADEICELLSCYSMLNERTGVKKLCKLSNQISKGLEKAFNSFNEYQFSKYNRDKEITLKDALCIVHPKPYSKEQSVIFKKILDDDLAVPYTWEVELSRAGQEKRDKKEVWEELIQSGKLGYMAILRNLRNFIEAGVSKECIYMVGEMISIEENVRRSKQLPFRFLAAYKAIIDLGKNNPNVMFLIESLEKALKVSVEALELFKNHESVLIAADVSGSMYDKVSARSEIARYDIGILLSMILNYKCEFVTAGMFGTSFKTYALPTNNIFDNVSNMYKRAGEVGYSTLGHKVIDFAVKSKHVYDKICIFTDEQMYGSERYGYNDTVNITKSWDLFKKKNPNGKLYLFNLAGYGGATPLKINENDIYTISGWSSEIFNVLHNLEEGGRVLDEISKISL